MRTTSLLIAAGAGAALYLVANSTRKHPLPAASAPQVVILGAGFGGLATAAKLTSRYGGQVRITLLDRHNYHLFTPMLYQAATCGIVPYDAAIPVRQWTGRQGIRFRQGTVRGIDLNNRIVQLDNGELSYDFLVIAIGGTTNFFGNQSAAKHALPMKTLEDGIVIRNHIIDTLERAAVTSDLRERTQLLTYVVVGGGATGVETAGAIAGLLRQAVPSDYPVLRDTTWHVTVLESGPKLLGHMGDQMADGALRELKNAGVDVRLNTSAKDLTTDRIATNSGETIVTGTVIWATGVRAPDVLAGLSAEHGHGGSMIVDEYLHIKGRSNAYAIGDNASVVDQNTNRPVPLLAASAMQQGKAAAENIGRSLSGRQLIAFRYRNLGNVVSVGPRKGVAEIAGKVVGGFAGWLVWRLVHLARLTNTRNQLATALDWTFGYFNEVDTARLGVRPPSKVA